MAEILDLSIVIPTRNRLHVLEQTIGAVCKGKGVPKEIIIVDQSDTPLRNSELEHATAFGIRMKILYQKQPSSTAARNMGSKNAECSIILFMDDDVMLDENSLIKLCGNFRNERTALVAAPNIGDKYSPKRYPDILGTLFLRKKPFKKGGYICKGAVLGRYPDKCFSTVNTEWAMGYFFAVRRDLMVSYDIRFDENLISYAYPEDLDFTHTFIKKAHEEGLLAILDPSIYVNHLGAAEGRIPSQKVSYMYVIHRYYLSYKHFKSGIMRLMLVWSDVGEFLRRLLTKQRPLDILKAHILCIKKLSLLRQGIIDKELQDAMR